MHGWNDSPLVVVRPVALRSPEAHMPIMASDCIDAPVQYGDAHIAAAEVHGCHFLPGVRAQIKPANSVEMHRTVKATDTVDVPVKEGSVVIGTRALLIDCQVDPQVSADVICLNAVSWIRSAPASDGQEDGVRHARTSDRVTHVQCRRGEAVFVVHDLFHHLKALCLAPDQLIGHHSCPQLILSHQGQPDLHGQEIFELNCSGFTFHTWKLPS